MTELTKLVTGYFATKAGLLSLDNTLTQSPTELASNETSGSYQWINCDTNTPINGETNQTFTPLTSGNYAVEVSNGSCVERSICVSFSVLSTEEFNPNDIRVYPNPVTHILKIENQSRLSLHITLNDISGKKLRTLKTKKGYLEIDVNDLTSGIYFVEIASQTKSSTIKIVKE